MTRYVWSSTGWVDTTGWKPRPQVFPSIHRDCMDALQHPCTGEMIDSKSKFREITRANGCREIGNDIPDHWLKRPDPVPEGLGQDIADAIEQLEQGAPCPELEAAGMIEGEAVETKMYEAAA